jgi:uroporphyrinogen-III synthase
MRVLITRPLEDGEETARQLESRGHQALVAPLLNLRFLEGPQIALDGVQAILATSANGVRALARRSLRRDIAIFAVGPQTAGEALKLGFQSVKSADGDAAALALAARSWAEPGKGALLHVAGEGNNGRLANALSAFTVRQEILYVVEAVDKMPDAAASALREGRLDAALFYSPRSAAVFAGCVGREGLPVNRLVAACISPAAAAGLAKLAFREMRTAARPDQAALLNLLD